MYNLEMNEKTGEKVYSTVLPNGLKVYICPKPGFTKKIGLYGTKYGSLDNEFIDIETGKRVKVEDGIAHFLEHKLFEQEGDNALDVFAKMGVSSNAYTSFDHTVYFFETNDRFEECVEKLLDFVNTPYFTDKNVEKEKGIIAQELKMYDDEPNAVVYYNTLKAMYNEFPLNVDIGGTVESVYKIDKEALYTCYRTFYNPENMYIIIMGDVEIEDTIKLISSQNEKRGNINHSEVVRFIKEEPIRIAEKRIEKKLDVYMPYICFGFKHEKQTGIVNIKNTIIVDLINEMYFSNLSDFYEDMYNNGLVNEPMQIVYESGEHFAHTILFAVSKKHEECEQRIKEYFAQLRKNGIDEKLFEIAKKKKIGEELYTSEDVMEIHRDIIDSIIQGINIFDKSNMLDKITVDDVNSFMRNNIREDNMVISKVIEKH